MNREQVSDMYETYAQKIGDRKQVYETIASTFDVKRALYPGSHVDITEVKKTMKGPRYTKQVENYMFRKI
ncbi:hypothetical protein [Exiguobacterium sp. s183]|uniref:hypothetical protein n=1 Tax=Exiguobacterium sp. s183 TaxID=2751262 RepID=UPI001BE742F8|nr:hypothetical protein [Exiguobacterium sp. s183]